VVVAEGWPEGSLEWSKGILTGNDGGQKKESCRNDSHCLKNMQLCCSFADFFLLCR